MFTTDSRYLKQPTATAVLANGTQVTYVVPRLPVPLPLVGYHQKVGQDRLDIVAVQYLNAPRGFWRLCDCNNAMLANSLEAHRLIGIPQGGAV